MSNEESTMKKYASLARKFKGQPVSEICADFKRANASDKSWEAPYKELARMAKVEDWNFSRPEFKKKGNNFPILVQYLDHTFQRVQELGEVKLSEDGKRSCFNTGLQTVNEKDIFVSFHQCSRKGTPDWKLYSFFDSYSTKLEDFHPPPKIATYIDDPSDLVFDTSFKIEVNFGHILDINIDRLPVVIRTNRTLAKHAITGSIDSLKQRVIRNYKIAIPHWYEGEIQLLLPLNIISPDTADVALVAEKHSKKRMYRIKTILDMSMAYIDARLITRPDGEWLNP